MSMRRRLAAAPEPMHRWPGPGGLSIAGDTWGDPAGPTVILQHGGGQTRHAWKGTGQRLADSGYFAVAYDARGHGDSDWDPDGRYTQDALVEDLLAVIAALGSPRAALVGASMGGGTSLVATGEDHVDATALVLVDIAPSIEAAGADNIMAFMRRNPDGFASLDDVATAIADYQPHRPRRTSLDGLAKNVRLGADDRYYWHWDPSILDLPRHLKHRQDRLEACARALTVPTLLVHGGLSDVISEEGVQEFLAACPHAEYVNVADAGHMVAGDRNDVFADAVIDFLNCTVRTDGAPTQSSHRSRPGRRPPGPQIADVP